MFIFTEGIKYKFKKKSANIKTKRVVKSLLHLGI